MAVPDSSGPRSELSRLTSASKNWSGLSNRSLRIIPEPEQGVLFIQLDSAHAGQTRPPSGHGPACFAFFELSKIIRGGCLFGLAPVLRLCGFPSAPGAARGWERRPGWLRVKGAILVGLCGLVGIVVWVRFASCEPFDLRARLTLPAGGAGRTFGFRYGSGLR